MNHGYVLLLHGCRIQLSGFECIMMMMILIMTIMIYDNNMHTSILLLGCNFVGGDSSQFCDCLVYLYYVSVNGLFIFYIAH